MEIMFAAGPSSSPLSYCTGFLVGTCHPNLGLPSPPPERGMMGSWVQKVALGGEGNGNPLQYSQASLVAQLVKNPLAMQETLV